MWRYGGTFTLQSRVHAKKRIQSTGAEAPGRRRPLQRWPRTRHASIVPGIVSEIVPEIAYDVVYSSLLISILYVGTYISTIHISINCDVNEIPVCLVSTISILA